MYVYNVVILLICALATHKEWNYTVDDIYFHYRKQMTVLFSFLYFGYLCV